MNTGVRVTVLAVATALTCAGVSPASAGGPIARIACAQSATGTCSESGNQNLPPDSTGSETTDTVPNSSSSVDQTLEPLNGSQLADFDSTWETVVSDHPSFGNIKNVVVRRVLTCAVVARTLAAPKVNDVWNSPTQGAVQAGDVYAAVLEICVQKVVSAQRTLPARDAAVTRPGCRTLFVAVPISISRVGRSYRVSTSGRSSRARNKPALSVSCRPKGRGIVISARPRRHGQRLRSVVGPHVRLGFSNPTSGPVGIRATFTFRAR